ncbi:hypothetical protein COK25_03235 [Bacillus cereus]|nr:hypothetical protein [Bacillus cereus]PEZ97144.1 hypothetical protein CN376_08535 [Bacillus cereus]PFE95847.1 hypothetical protein CN323_23035 [Bacillus cereus]PFQ57612.1 hypothetical protein COK25_03235 [Bacillus cereus]
MQKQFKLFKNVHRITPRAEMLTFLDSKLIGVEYSPNSKNLWTVTNSMTNQGCTQLFLTPRYFRKILLNTKEIEGIRINHIGFSVEPEIEIGVLLDAFYNKEKEESKRIKRLSDSLLNLLSENEAIKFSFYIKDTNPVTKINIYQTGLMHVSNNLPNLNRFDELFKGVL